MKIYLSYLRLGLCAVALWAEFPGSSQAGVIEQTQGPFALKFYGNGDTDGSTTGSQDWTAQQIADVVATVNVWDSRIDNVAARQIDLHLFWNNMSGGTLGGSDNYFYGDYSRAVTASELAWRKNDSYQSPTAPWDALIIMDTDAAGYGWNFGSGTPSGQIDFRSVLAHEFGHSLGFITTYDSATDKWWLGGVTAWDSNLRDDQGNRPAADSTGTSGNFNQTDNPVWFVGANAMAANGGLPVAIYAPSPYRAGSSLAHLDEGTFSNLLMSPFVAPGQVVRSPSDLEWAIMKDLGWDINAVPEPSTFALLLGLSGIGMFVARRRRKSEAQSGSTR